MADRAAFPQCLVFKDKWPGLLAMAFSTTFVPTRHRKSTRGFVDVESVRVVAIDTVHAPFNHRMMLRELELRVRGQVTLKAGFGVLAGVDDELAAAPALVFLEEEKVLSVPLFP